MASDEAGPDGDGVGGDGPDGDGVDGGAPDGALPDAESIGAEHVAALGALGNRRRLAILFALADRARETGTDRNAMSFTALYEAVDVASSSQFAYHLDQLVGPFVAETDDGYHLTYGGEKIVRAVRAGVFESAAAFDPVAVEGSCVACGAAALEALVREERFVVRCGDCDTPLVTDSFPRSQAVGRTPEAVVESFTYRIWSTYLLVRGDVCPECYGRVERRVDAHEAVGRYTFASVCDACGFTIHLPVEVPAAFHPRAMAFLARHDFPLLERPLWEFLDLVAADAWTTTVRSASPLDARFRVEIDGDVLDLAMDDDFDVTAVDGDADDG